MSRALGITDRKLTELHQYRDSDAYDDVERVVLEFAEAMSTTPTRVTDELRERVLQHLTQGQVAELAATIAWEHHRARLNRALGVREMGFSDGTVCVLPERLSPSP